MFEATVLPLIREGSIDIRIDVVEETAQAFTGRRIHFVDIDLVLLEGIFIFRREFRDHFDLRIWIECPFEKALERAVCRSQEGLEREETIAVYDRIYFPAQQMHIARDEPRSFADVVFRNG